MTTVEEVSYRIIVSNRYMTIATTGVNDLGEPGVWVSPVAYVRDGEANLYWYSAVDAVHSVNIQNNPYVAVSIFNSTEPSSIVDGLQLVCEAGEVPNADLPQIMDLYFTQSFPSAEERESWLRPRSDFEGDAVQRFYVAKVRRAYKINNDIPKVDRRLQVDFEAVRALFKDS